MICLIDQICLILHMGEVGQICLILPMFDPANGGGR